MHIIRCSTLVVAASTLLGCGEAANTVAPAVTGTQPSLSVSASKESEKSDVPRKLRVDMLDKCDQPTFDAAVGPGTCTRPHGTPFATFIAELTLNRSVRAWRNEPSQMEASVGQTIVAYNRGGEVHTFTKVANYGGGIVPLLNQLSGTPNVAPECNALGPQEFVPPGGSDTEDPFTSHEVGTVKFMCCIHPWMKTTVKVERTHGDRGEHEGHGG